MPEVTITAPKNNTKDSPVELEEVVITAQGMPRVGDEVMEPLDSWWDYIENFLDGGRTYFYTYSSITIFNFTLTHSIPYTVDKNGRITGQKPAMGTPPLVGAGKVIRIKGLKQAINSRKFHDVTKPNILKEVGKKIPNWRSKVGDNPNIAIKNGEIILQSVDKYGKTSGKTLETGIKASTFF